VLRDHAGHGDLWSCSPSAVKGGSVAARLLRMGRTNGIELSPDEKTLYVSEAFNREFIPVSNVVWQFDVDILTGKSVL
jgi:gluconolactonase